MRWLLALPVALSALGCSTTSYSLDQSLNGERYAVGVPALLRGTARSYVGSCGESTLGKDGLALQSGMGGGVGGADSWGCTSDLRVVSVTCVEADACQVETVGGEAVLTPLRSGIIHVTGVVQTDDGEEEADEITLDVIDSARLRVSAFDDEGLAHGFEAGAPVLLDVEVMSQDGTPVCHAPQKVLVATTSAPDFVPAATYVSSSYYTYEAPAAETIQVRLGALEAELTLPIAK